MLIFPRLKGHFSRLNHQQSRFHASTPAQILTDLTLRVPATAHTPYFYDTIGNVSTSHFRPGSTPASQAKSSKIRTSPRTIDGVLELSPRYPLLGGWNYSFIVGYDMPLEEVLKTQGSKKILGVPFLTGWRDLLVDDAELKVILPEGARWVQRPSHYQSLTPKQRRRGHRSFCGRQHRSLDSQNIPRHHRQTRGHDQEGFRN